MTLYTKLPHDKLKSKLSSIVNFTCNWGYKTLIRLSKNGTAYWVKTKGDLVLVDFVTVINHLIENCYFNVGKVTMKLSLGIPIGTTLHHFEQTF